MTPVDPVVVTPTSGSAGRCCIDLSGVAPVVTTSSDVVSAVGGVPGDDSPGYYWSPVNSPKLATEKEKLAARNTDSAVAPTTSTSDVVSAVGVPSSSSEAAYFVDAETGQQWRRRSQPHRIYFDTKANRWRDSQGRFAKAPDDESKYEKRVETTWKKGKATRDACFQTTREWLYQPIDPKEEAWLNKQSSKERKEK